MFEYVPFSIALVGSAIAGAWDLKTTEIPDVISHLMIVLALAFWSIQSYLLNDYWLIAQSLLVGLSLLGLGFLMYYFGQWGGGDAKILSAVGFLMPSNILGSARLLLPFPVSFLVNVFLLGAVYMIIYALVLSVRNREIIRDFLNNMKASSKNTLIFFSFISVFLFALTYYLSLHYGLGIRIAQSAYISLASSVLYVALISLWKFVMSVEKVGFRRSIPVRKLRVGDVLLESRFWEGLTKEQVGKIKKSGKKVITIKDGVRFGPVFVIALLFTVFVGDAIALFLNMV